MGRLLSPFSESAKVSMKMRADNTCFRNSFKGRLVLNVESGGSVQAFCELLSSLLSCYQILDTRKLHVY